MTAVGVLSRPVVHTSATLLTKGSLCSGYSGLDLADEVVS